MNVLQNVASFCIKDDFKLHTMSVTTASLDTEAVNVHISSLGVGPHIASPICCVVIFSRKHPHIQKVKTLRVILLSSLLCVLQGSWVLPLRRISTASSTSRPGTIFCHCLCAAKCPGTASSPTLIPKVRARQPPHPQIGFP